IVVDPAELVHEHFEGAVGHVVCGKALHHEFVVQLADVVQRETGTHQELLLSLVPVADQMPYRVLTAALGPSHRQLSDFGRTARLTPLPAVSHQPYYFQWFEAPENVSRLLKFGQRQPHKGMIRVGLAIHDGYGKDD